MPGALIGLGANLGNPPATFDSAVSALAAHQAVQLVARSRNYRTAPIGGPAAQPAYINAAAVVETSLAPSELLALLHQVETLHGRQRAEHWGPRTLDLDLLLYDQQQINSPELTVPHPRFAFRRFALEPAAEIASDWVHPTVGWTIQRLVDHARNAIPYFAITGLPGIDCAALAKPAAKATGARLILPPHRDDPAQLATAGRALQLFAERVRLLEAATWAEPARPAISSFWIEESLAEIEARSDLISQQEWTAAWLQSRRQVVAPKLIVYLVESDPVATDPVVQPFQAALTRRLSQHDVGVVLHLSQGCFDEQVDEVVAAINAMQTPGISLS